MLARIFGVWALAALTAATAWGQAPAASGPPEESASSRADAGGNWQASADDGVAPVQSDAPPPSENRSTERAPGERSSIARVSKGSGVLPNEAGQVWREYDISPYTSRVGDTEKPERAIVDWILRETGTETWFSETPALLHADGDTLRVYHTPEMQSVVSEMVDRFVASAGEPHVLGLTLVTIGDPDWRAKTKPIMTPVSVQSPGVEAWLMSPENAAYLLSELRKRSDYTQHQALQLVIPNGQSQSLSKERPRQYLRDVRFTPGVHPGYQLETGQIDEGYTLEISPLLSLDGEVIDAVIKTDIDQVEKIVPVTVEVPALPNQPQSVQIQVPQLVSWRLHERFRWPKDQVLVLSCGVVAAPGGKKQNPLGITNPFASAARADALLFLESNGKASQTLVTPATASAAPISRGRY